MQHDELLALVTDAKAFILEKLDSGEKHFFSLNRSSYAISPSFKEKSLEKPKPLPPKVSRPVPKAPPEPLIEPEIQVSIAHPPAPKPQKTVSLKFSFQLAPAPHFIEKDLSEMKHLIRRFSVSKPIDPPADLIFFLTRQNGLEREFMEKIAEACASILGAGAIVFVKTQEDLLHFSSAKLLIGSPFAKGIPIHQPTLLFGTIPFLPLAPLEEYRVNQSLKRSLWQALKTLASKNTSPSSST